LSEVFLLFAFRFTHGRWVMYPYVYPGLLTAELHAKAGPLTQAGRGPMLEVNAACTKVTSETMSKTGSPVSRWMSAV